MKDKYPEEAVRKYPHALTLHRNVAFPTGWLSTDSVHYVTCPRCGAKPGFLCVTPSGTRGSGLTGGAHGERQGALRHERPDIADLARIRPRGSYQPGEVIPSRVKR